MTNPSFSNSRAYRIHKPSVSKFSNSLCVLNFMETLINQRLLKYESTGSPWISSADRRYFILLYFAFSGNAGYQVNRIYTGCPFHCQITEQSLSLSCPAGSSGPGAFLRAPWGTRSHHWGSPRQPARTPCSPAPLSQRCPAFWDR